MRDDDKNLFLEKIDYIGVDIDNASYLTFIKAFFNAQKFGVVVAEQIEDRYHLKIYGDFTRKQQYVIRTLLSDDLKHGAVDELKEAILERSKNPVTRLIVDNIINTLFDGKYKPPKIKQYTTIYPTDRKEFKIYKDSKNRVTTRT